MPTLSAKQLDRMRAQVGDLLPDTCVIQAATTSKDSAGRSSSTWGAVTGGTVACRVDPTGQGQLLNTVDALREQQEVRYQLTVPYTAPIAAGVRVVTGGKTYEVLQLDVDHSWKVSRRAIVVERR